MLTLSATVCTFAFHHKKRAKRDNHTRYVSFVPIAAVVIGFMQLSTTLGFCAIAFWQKLFTVAYVSLGAIILALAARTVSTVEIFFLLKAQGHAEHVNSMSRKETALLIVGSSFVFDTVVFFPWAQHRFIETELLGFPNVGILRLSLLQIVLQTFPALIIQVSYFLLNGQEAGSYVYFSMLVSFCAL